MNGGTAEIVQEFRSRPQEVLDRLVDGELGLEDRRTLLAALDDEPGAWRQCALAFVEAQSFGWQLARIAHEPLVAQEIAPGRLPSAERRVGRLAWPLALAASVLVAFLLGGRFAELNALTAELAGNPVKGDSQAADDPSTLTSLAVPLKGNDEAIELPVDSEDLAANAAGRSFAISSALAQQFQRDGFEVNRQQQLWPVELPDGRKVLVPVEEVHIQSPEVQRL